MDVSKETRHFLSCTKRLRYAHDVHNDAQWLSLDIHVIFSRTTQANQSATQRKQPSRSADPCSHVCPLQVGHPRSPQGRKFLERLAGHRAALREASTFQGITVTYRPTHVWTMIIMNSCKPLEKRIKSGGTSKMKVLNQVAPNFATILPWTFQRVLPPSALALLCLEP